MGQEKTRPPVETRTRSSLLAGEAFFPLNYGGFPMVLPEWVFTEPPRMYIFVLAGEVLGPFGSPTFPLKEERIHLSPESP